jgi:hypothetical protein
VHVDAHASRLHLRIGPIAVLQAVYTFHDGLATLEAEVGRSLRSESR